MTYTEVERELHKMQPRQKLYELVRREMQRRGRWKLKDRGAYTSRSLIYWRSVTIDEASRNKQIQQAPAMTYAQSFRIDAIFHSIDPGCHKLCLTALVMAKTAVRLA